MTTFVNLVAGTSDTTGTGAYSVDGSVTRRRPLTDLTDATQYAFLAEMGSDYELFLGTYTASGTTISRDSILESSNSDAAVNWGAGTKTLSVVATAAMLTALATNHTAVVDDSGGAVVAFDHDTSTELTDGSSLLARWKNNGTLKASFDKDGHLVCADQYFLDLGAGFVVFNYGAIFGASLGIANNTLTLNASSGAGEAYVHPNTGAAAKLILGLQAMLIDAKGGELRLGGNHAVQTGSNRTNNIGGATLITSGDGNVSAGAAKDASSGDITIRPGTARAAGNTGDIIFERGTVGGTGAKGNIMMADLPTSSAGLPTGALWNDSGTLKVA